MDKELLAPLISGPPPPKKIKEKKEKGKNSIFFSSYCALYEPVNWVDLVIISSKLEIDSFFVPKLFVPNDYSSRIQSLHVCFPIWSIT